MHEQFFISGDYIELNKLLKASGICITGGQAKTIIAEGLVTVDNQKETRKGRKIKNGMIVKYGDHSIQVLSQKSS